MNKNEYINRYGKEAYDKMQQKCKEWKSRNKERVKTTQNEYRKTKYGRALHITSRYAELDKIHNRGECTLTTEQLIQLWDNGCYWCGETDWHKLGADRIDNLKPHTIENCVCCCSDCNNERMGKSFEYFKKIKNIIG